MRTWSPVACRRCLRIRPINSGCSKGRHGRTAAPSWWISVEQARWSFVPPLALIPTRAVASPSSLMGVARSPPAHACCVASPGEPRAGKLGRVKMQSKRPKPTTGIEPPRLPKRLPPGALSGGQLADQGNFEKLAFTNIDWSSQEADDVYFEAVLFKHIIMNGARLPSLQ